MPKEKNAVVTSRTTKKGYQVLMLELTLKNGETILCEISLNPYNKKGLGKLYYKVTHNVETYTYGNQEEVK